MARSPVNLRKQDDTPAGIAEATDYAIQVAGGYLEWLTRAWGPGAVSAQPLLGKRVIEIGPGPTLGSAALLACAGARVSVADRFLAVWDPAFHPAFFTELLSKLEARGDTCGEPLRRMLSDGRFASAIDCHALGAEQIIDIEGQFDAVLSNAVLEHVEDIHIAAANFVAKTAPGGVGFHQVDFRDHRSFDRPLEFLTLDDEAFDRLRSDCHCECGGRWRASDVVAAFEAVGFTVHVDSNMFAPADYLAEVRPRLQPKFATLADGELGAVSARFTLTRASRPNAHGIEPEFFIEASRGVREIADHAGALAERFRGRDLEGANEALVGLTNELRQFAALVEALRGPLAIDPHLLMIDNRTPDEQLARLAGQLQGLIDAQLNADWLGVADILEFDLTPLLRPWGPRVLACGRVA